MRKVELPPSVTRLMKEEITFFLNHFVTLLLPCIWCVYICVRVCVHVIHKKKKEMFTFHSNESCLIEVFSRLQNFTFLCVCVCVFSLQGRGSGLWYRDRLFSHLQGVVLCPWPGGLSGKRLLLLHGELPELRGIPDPRLLLPHQGSRE